MSLRYCLPQGLFFFHFWVIQEIPLKSAVWTVNRNPRTRLEWGRLLNRPGSTLRVESLGFTFRVESLGCNVHNYNPCSG